jgi:hypothetical protein
MNIPYAKIQLCMLAMTMPCAVSIASAQETRSQSETVHSPITQGASLERTSNAVVVKPASSDSKGQIQIPRFAASLRAMYWGGGSSETLATQGLSLSPEQEHWVIKWSERPNGSETIRLDFDNPPLLVDEIDSIKASGDGGFLLPAHLAKISGQKVRYEPQMHKNTVGYWTGKQDSATWSFELEKSGKFNVGILQGCGKDQGGSAAKIEIIDGDETQAMLEFKVLETGHFQNFQWRHLGTIELAETGVLELKISPKAIERAALMDVRAVSLVRLPD